MQGQQVSLACVLESFGSCYDVAHSIWMERVGLPSNHQELLTSPLKSLCFFATYAHERGGTNPRFALYHRVAIQDVYRLHRDILSEAFADTVWDRFVRYTNGRPNKKLTEGPVKGVLARLRDSGESNLLTHLRSLTLERAYNWLIGIRGIKHKIASFLLRDLWSYIGPWSDTPVEHLKYLQPIDRWVRFWSEQLDDKWPSADLDFADRLVGLCRVAGIDPVQFNKGAWCVGSHFDRLCDFFKVPEVKRVDLSIVRTFGAEDVLRAVIGFRDHHEPKIFWV